MEDKSQFLDLSSGRTIVELVDIRNDQFPIATILRELSLSCIRAPILYYILPVAIIR